MLGALVLALATGGTASAQTTAPAGSSHDTMGAMHGGQNDMQGMKGMHMNTMGMHMMPATVKAVDTKPGVVDVMTEGMALKVRFPPPAVANLKEGDKIALHVGFSKP